MILIGHIIDFFGKIGPKMVSFTILTGFWNSMIALPAQSTFERVLQKRH